MLEISNELTQLLTCLPMFELEGEELRLLQCHSVSLDEWFPTFRKAVLPSQTVQTFFDCLTLKVSHTRRLET
jgi:hypothetical protein